VKSCSTGILLASLLFVRFVHFVVRIFGFANLAEDLAPRLAGAGSRSNSASVSSSACRSAGVGEPPSGRFGFVMFGEPGEELGYQCPLEESTVMNRLNKNGFMNTQVVRAKMCSKTDAINC
jgi:hypothetical protein